MEDVGELLIVKGVVVEANRVEELQAVLASLEYRLECHAVLATEDVVCYCEAVVADQLDDRQVCRK